MLLISDNLNLTRAGVAEAVEMGDAGSIRELAHKVTDAGAQALDVSVAALGTSHAARSLEWLVDEIQSVTGVQLSLDAASGDAVLAGAERADRKPIINAYSVMSARPGDLTDKLLPYAGEHGLEVILPLLEGPGPPVDAERRVELAVEMVEKAEAAGVARRDIYVDPVIVHLIADTGQMHSAAVLQTMQLLGHMFDPPVKTVAGVAYLSKGNPPELRSPLNRTYLAMLSAHGLDAALVDIRDREMMRDIRLIQGLRNESLYSQSDAELT